MSCSMLQLVVWSSRGSGCGFVVVAVLFPCLLSVTFFSIRLQWVNRQVAVDCMDMASGAPPAQCAKAGHYVCGHLRCQFISTVMPFELLLYHKLIFAFFGFAVRSNCQTRSLFLCIVSSINVISNSKQTYTGFTLKIPSIYSFNSFQFFQEKERESSRSHLPVSPSNKRNFLCISLRTS